MTLSQRDQKRSKINIDSKWSTQLEWLLIKAYIIFFITYNILPLYTVDMTRELTVLFTEFVPTSDITVLNMQV